MANVVLTSTRSEDFTNEYEGICESVSRSFDLLDYNLDHNVDSVIIKPNLCYYWDYSTGETTDPRVVSAVIDYIREKIGNDVQISVAEADASAMKTKYAFRILGYEELSRRKKVTLVNLSEGDIAKKEVRVGKKKFVLEVNNMLLESDLMINVPKLKYHRIVGVTCGLKNIYGAISTPRKYVYHSEISDVIVGINKIVKSNLVLVDGIISKGKYPKKMGVIIASDNVLSADFVAAKILGYDPRTIPYINLAEKEKIGSLDINLIEDGASLREIQDVFPRKNHLSEKIMWKLQLQALDFYSRLVGDTVPPALEE